MHTPRCQFTVITAFLVLTSPVIGKMNAFTVLQTFSAISIDGATFYFFTNTAAQYKGGPNFSIWFYTTGLGILVAVCNLIGLWSYNRWMKEWNYRSIFYFSNLLVSAVHLWGILIYSRYNLKIGIPDHTFALTTAAMFSITHQWMWMPNILLLGQLCPAGVEATMYALLAGCHNLGSSGAAMLGAYALEYFGVTPNGSEDEGHRFDQLWKVALLGCILPTLTILMIPVCIPDAKQTERLLDDSHLSATDGSPWQRSAARREHHTRDGAETAAITQRRHFGATRPGRSASRSTPAPPFSASSNTSRSQIPTPSRPFSKKLSSDACSSLSSSSIPS
jgi:hypothetical protein